MKFKMLFAAAVACSIAFAEALKVSIVADRADCMYKCGEETVFTITAKDSKGILATNGNLRVRLDNFGAEKFFEAEFDLTEQNPVSVKGTLTYPGFLAVKCTVLDNKNHKTGTKVFSTAYEPEKIKQGVAKPDDFDSFWDNAVRKFDETVPLDPVVTPMPEKSTRDYTLSRVSFATVNGRRVYGYLSVPTDVSKAPFPVRVQVPGAGCGSWSNNPMVAKEAICLFMSVYPFEPDTDLKVVKPKAEALNKELRRKYKVSGYSRAGLAVSREEYFYYPVILGINRAVNWVVSREDANKKHVTYSGTSQGGGFGLYLMGLNGNFTKGVVFVPALTDLLGSKDRNRQSGWPCVVEAHPEELKAAVERNAPYFCGANFASRIKIPIRFVAGFADLTCAPGAVYSGYNAVASKDKKIYHGIGMGHSVNSNFYRDLGEWQKK